MPFVYAYRVQEDASNKPDASTAYDLSGTAETGARSFAGAVTDGDLADGDECVVLAEEVDADGNPAGAWELVEGTYNDLATDTITRGTLIQSSSGSKIDWSATGEDATPRLSVVNLPTGSRRLFSSGTVSGTPTYLTLADTTTPFRAGYDYEFELYNLRLNNDTNYLKWEVYESGVGWFTGNDNHDHYTLALSYRQGATSGYVGINQSKGHVLSTAQGNLNTAGSEERHTVRGRIFDPAAAGPSLMRLLTRAYNPSNGDMYVGQGLSGMGDTLDAHVGLRFYPNTGTFDNYGGWRCWEIG